MNNAIMNVLMQVFLWTCVFIYVGCKLKSGIAGASIICTSTLLEIAWMLLAKGLLKEREMENVGTRFWEESFRDFQPVIWGP